MVDEDAGAEEDAVALPPTAPAPVPVAPPVAAAAELLLPLKEGIS